MEINTRNLSPSFTYHVYNRAVGSEVLFKSAGHYQTFMTKYKSHISPLVDTFCYCLMSNHFHFLLRVKNENEIIDIYKQRAGAAKVKLEDKEVSNFISRQFSHLFNGYTQAFNKDQNRNGSLFTRPFKRKLVEDERHLKKLVHYIHYNPLEAGLCERPHQYAHSSYCTLVSTKATLLNRTEVLDWFGDLENFKACHQYPPELTGIDFS